MATTLRPPDLTGTSSIRRLRVLRIAPAVSGLVTVTYLWMFFAIRAAEAGLPENTFGAYLQLTVIYTIGTVLLLTVQSRWVWGIGAAVQVVVLGLFLTFGLAIFNYEAVAGLPVALWAVTITTAQLLLLGLLSYLTLSPTKTPPETT